MDVLKSSNATSKMIRDTTSPDTYSILPCLLETIAYIKKEREYLQQGLKKLKLKIYPSEANFILLYSKVPLKEKLLKKGILIRDCDNFRGLTKGFYRIAVKQREDNERLLQELEEIV